MSESASSGVYGVLGGVISIVGYYLIKRLFERQQESLSTKKRQLEYVFSPLEILMKMNKREYDRYFDSKTTSDDKIWIEKHVWYPNMTEMKRIIMERSHLLPEIPEHFLDLLNHMESWFAEYDLVHVQKVKKSPVFAGTKGDKYPRGIVDQYVFDKAKELRKSLKLK